MNAFPAGPAPLVEADAPPTTETLRPWQAADGSVFNTYVWTPPTGAEAGRLHPAALVLAIHGLGGAGSDFRPLGAVLARQGIAVHAPDLRGQGSDPAIARRGNVGDLREVVRDLRAFAGHLAAAHPGTPIFLYGESMGAMLALHLAAGWEEAASPRTEPPAGLILASPVIAFEVPLGWWRRAWFRVLLGAAPGFRLPVRGLPSRGRRPPAEAPRVTRDEAHTEYLRHAPHRLRTVTPRFLHSLLTMIQHCADAAPALRLPVLALYAGRDIFVRPAQVEAVFERIGSREKTRQLFPESYHLLLHDHDCDAVLAAIRSWVGARLPTL